MDGSTAFFIATPIVMVVGLSVWLTLVMGYAARHPRWKHGAQAQADADQDATSEKHAEQRPVLPGPREGRHDEAEPPTSRQ